MATDLPVWRPEAGHPPAPLPVPVPPAWRHPDAPPRGVALHPPLRQLVERRLLDRYAPAHVVVNHAGDTVHFSAGTGRFLEAAAGAPSRNLLAMARWGLRLDLGAALQEAMRTRRLARRTALASGQGGQPHPVAITVEPIGGDAGDPLFLTTFMEREEGRPPGPLEAAAAARPDAAAAMDRLEAELIETRDRLQASSEAYETALEELKAANEDMGSMNEELQSANEELRTAKEEQQAVNEELHTVNTEMCVKIEALDRANSDLRNLFENTHIATILLDRRQVIRSFTPSSAGVFSLLPGDVGRPLTDITCALDYPELRADIEEVLRTGAPRERPEARRDGRGHHLARLVACRATDGRIDGLLATFAEITSVARAEAHQRMLVAELNHRVKNILAVVVGIAAGSLPGGPGRDAFIARLKALSRAHELLAREHWTAVRLADILHGTASLLIPAGDDRLTLSGPDLPVPPRVAQSLTLILHELATNAAGHGSLSAGTGRVEVSWHRSHAGGRSRLHLVWRETGGPKVRRRRRSGFGSRVVEREVRAGGGTLELDFAPDGLRASIELPLDEPPMPAPFAAAPPGIDRIAAPAPPPGMETVSTSAPPSARRGCDPDPRP